jgi:hypothetical protein
VISRSECRSRIRAKAHGQSAPEDVRMIPALFTCDRIGISIVAGDSALISHAFHMRSLQAGPNKGLRRRKSLSRAAYSDGTGSSVVAGQEANVVIKELVHTARKDPMQFQLALFDLAPLAVTTPRAEADGLGQQFDVTRKRDIPKLDKPAGAQKRGLSFCAMYLHQHPKRLLELWGQPGSLSFRSRLVSSRRRAGG